jgi:hypothetical protein
VPLLETARTGFELLLSISAGSGLLYLLRWHWWRINAWNEIAAWRFRSWWQSASLWPAGWARVSAEHGPVGDGVRHHVRVDSEL